MKSKKTKQTTVVLAIILAFFLGRESKALKRIEELKQSNYIADSFNSKSNYNKEVINYSLSLKERSQKVLDTVYRCGQSKIYHPNTSHGSFKRCNSKVYKLTIEKAKRLGMRHCKCSG